MNAHFITNVASNLRPCNIVLGWLMAVRANASLFCLVSGFHHTIEVQTAPMRMLGSRIPCHNRLMKHVTYDIAT
jgi:hypothetical protein